MARSVEVSRKSEQGGKLVRACVLVEGERAAAVTFTGDFFLEPPELLDELGHAVSGTTRDKVAARVEAWFARQNRIMLIGAVPEDFAALVMKALGDASG
jgi:hypothetical protein